MVGVGFVVGVGWGVRGGEVLCVWRLFDGLRLEDLLVGIN